MSETSTGLLLLILALLIACSAFFSSSETGMMSLNRYRLKHLSKKGNQSARRAERMLGRPDRLLGTILVGNNIVNILAASLATIVAVRIWGDAGIAVATVALTVVILIFGEITPKTLAALRPEAIAFRVSRPLAVLQRLLYPIVWLCNTLSNGLLRLLGITLENAQAAQLSADELRTVVNEASLGITPRRQNMLLSILDMERMTVNDIIAEPLDVHRMYATKQERNARVLELMDYVGLNSEHAARYAHEFSGGQRQRIGIARALAINPDFIVCDEPVSALDVSIQAQVINMFDSLQEKLDLTYLFIAHDLLVVRHISTRIAVMYLGKMVELAPAEEIYNRPLHPYSRSLLSAVPIPDPKVARANKRIVLSGDIPSPLNAPSGCPFRTRCKYAAEECAQSMPPFEEVETGRFVACHRLAYID